MNRWFGSVRTPTAPSSSGESLRQGKPGLVFVDSCCAAVTFDKWWSTMSVILAQQCYIANRKSAERVDRPKEFEAFARASFALVSVVTDQNRRAIWNKSKKVERADD
jgi:hypothetical protein